ncbi:MAG: hypothetical protein KAH30_03420 [Caldisericia bacterium]|nr:hypothetical protein [Caldisericia bacterium]
MKRLIPMFLITMLIITMTPVIAFTIGLSSDDFKPSRKLLVEMFLEPE